MKNFIVKILIFSIVFFAFDKLFILLRNRAPELEVDRRLEVLLEGKMDADLLIFGSSVGARGIIASAISKELNIKAYNLSYPGSNIDFHEYLLTQLLENGNKKPKTILLTVDEPSELILNGSINFRLERLYPLIKYAKVREELIAREEKSKLLSSLFVLYQFNKSHLDLRKRNFTAHDSMMHCGSMPSNYVTANFPNTYGLKSDSYKKENESTLLLKKFNSFVQLCHNNKIKLVLVFPPKFKTRNILFEERMIALTRNKAIYLIYNDQNPAYQNKSYYVDASHLKANGARLFSHDVALFLKAQP